MSGGIEAIADVATGVMAAHAVDGGHDTGHDEHSGPCLNCGTQLIGPHCHQCGQSAHIHRTAMALFHDIAHGVFHFEGRTWHTLPMLFWKPGELTRRYVHGERVNFVSPMALFLFSVFLMVAAFGLIGGPFMSKTSGKDALSMAQGRTEAANDLARTEKKIAALIAKRDTLTAKLAQATEPDEKGTIKGDLGTIKGDLAELRSDEAALRLVTSGKIKPDVKDADLAIDGNTIHTGVPGVDQIVKHYSKNPELAAYKLQSSAYKFSWALIPISLPFIWLLFAFRRDVGMYDHAIFATYSLSAMTLMVVALSIANGIGLWTGAIGLILVFFPPWHMYRQLKGAYLLGRFGALWRTVALIIAAYTSALLFFIFLLSLEAAH